MINAVCFIGGLIVGFIITAIGYRAAAEDEAADAYMNGYEDGLEDGMNARE